jgi:vitamin-K-epoxide reductase (warfarin-sensitive)
MRYLIAILALAGLIVSCFALREHFRTDPSPCSINERWDCGVVNHSPFAELAGVPVAVFGIAGYAAIAGFALARRWWIVLLLTTGAVGFSAYLTYVEARLLETYCIWCVTSAGIISLTEVAAIIGVARRHKKPS